MYWPAKVCHAAVLTQLTRDIAFTGCVLQRWMLKMTTVGPDACAASCLLNIAMALHTCDSPRCQQTAKIVITAVRHLQMGKLKICLRFAFVRSSIFGTGLAAAGATQAVHSHFQCDRHTCILHTVSQVTDVHGTQNWIEEVSSFLKQQDPNHLVTVGEEGFYGKVPNKNVTPLAMCCKTLMVAVPVRLVCAMLFALHAKDVISFHAVILVLSDL